MQIGMSPKVWEEAGSSAEAKLIMEMDGWLWIEMGLYAGMGNDKILMPNIKWTGSVLTSFEGESDWERSYQLYFLISVLLL